MSPPRFVDKLAGQRILLIGGTGGVGIAVAQALLEYGATIILSSSRESKVKQVVADLTAHFPDAKSSISGYACDMASANVEDNIRALFVQVANVDHIVYMAGDRLPMIPLEDVTLETWQRCNQSRNSSITYTSGSICNKPIAGGWSMLALIGAGINGLARQLAFDLAPIRVNAVAPGVIDTDIWQALGEEGNGEFFQQHEASKPTGKVGQPEDLAEAYIYCLKDKNATGVVIHSNSGTFLQ